VNILKVFCEVFTKTFLPAIRAIIAEKLIEKYNLTQIEAAKKMGLTQAAISHYLRSKRGAKAYNILKGNKEIEGYIDKLVDIIYSNGSSSLEIYQYMCKICEWLRQRKNLVKEVASEKEEILYPKTR